MAKKPARGIRNNNPGNIDYSAANQWQGQLRTDLAIEPRFVRFDTPENGIRALAKLLISYQRRYGLYSVAQIIGRWAPGNENDTGSYVDIVSAAVKRAGFDTGRLDMNDRVQLEILVRAIMHHENGGYPYDDAIVREGTRRALE